MHQTDFPTILISILESEVILQHFPNRTKNNRGSSQIKHTNILILYR